MSHLETALPWSQVIERRHGYLHIWGSLVHVRPYINTLAGIHLLLGILEKFFCELGINELFVKFLELYAMNTCRCLKKSVTVRRGAPYDGTQVRRT